jgi:hypothetical protein
MKARSGVRSIAWIGVIALLGGIASASARAGSKQEMQSLDEQVQEIKSDVLGIASELNRLEEKLLHPSHTQVSIFVSMPEGETLRVDSVRVRIDGELVAHHIYSWKELEALKKGGVQRIYTGNVRSGQHQLEVAVAGKLAGGNDVAGTETFGFSKEVGPKLVGVTLAGGESGALSIRLGDW